MNATDCGMTDMPGGKMKQIAAIILTLVMACGLAACGSNDAQGEKTDAQSPQTEQSTVSDPETKTASYKYHQLLESDDSQYYYEASVKEEFVEDDMKETYLKGEARDGKGNYVLLTGEEELDMREIDKQNAYYYVYDAEKEYTKEDLEPSAEEEEEMELVYTESSQMELDGKNWDYDEYQGTYEFEGFTEDDQSDSGESQVVTEEYLFTKRYLTDKNGQLYGIFELQEKIGEDGKENQTIYQKLEKITKFQEGTYPKNVFQIPKDYEQAAAYPEEEILTEE